MTFGKQFIFFAIFILSFTSASQAQETLSLQDALNYALNNSEAVRKAKLDILKGDYQIKEVRAGALPQIDGTATLTNNILAQQFILPAEFMGGEPGEFIAVKAGTTWSSLAQVQLNQQLFNQQVFTGLKAAKSSKDFYLMAAKVAEENLLQQVASNYYQVIITREQLAVIDANIERNNTLEKTVSSQYEVGLARKIDLDRVKVNSSNLKAQKEELLNAVAQQENLLKYYMGMPVTQSIVIPETSLEELEATTANLIAENNFDLNKLSSFLVLKEQEELLGFQKKAIEAEFYPSLSLGANYMYNTQSNDFNLYTKHALNYDMSALTLTLRIPIFDGGARSSRLKQASLDIQKLQEDIKESSNGLQMAYENAKIQINNSLITIETQNQNKILAEEVYHSTKNNYNNGLASLTDLLTAETELVTAQNSYNQALLNYKIAEIELIKSQGNIKSLINE
ncbi:TolC family protein [Albibacterium indicum]|uniref:TolC family protein n=1 Tax=Albibacterium indicum TaxID=2292082 RepID=UPI000E479376|nr:TolC family protein [Pedobacter indicus]